MKKETWSLLKRLGFKKIKAFDVNGDAITAYSMRIACRSVWPLPADFYSYGSSNGFKSSMLRVSAEFERLAAPKIGGFLIVHSEKNELRQRKNGSGIKKFFSQNYDAAIDFNGLKITYLSKSEYSKRVANHDITE